MSSRAHLGRSVSSLVLMLLTIGVAARLAQVTAAQPPASSERVVAAMNREIASAVIANHTFTFSTALHAKDRDGAAEVMVTCWWPTEARTNVGEALGEFCLKAGTLCRHFGRKFDSTYGSDSPSFDQKTQRYRLDLRYWISKPSGK
jgi:hypothetical protein